MNKNSGSVYDSVSAQIHAVKYSRCKFKLTSSKGGGPLSGSVHPSNSARNFAISLQRWEVRSWSILEVSRDKRRDKSTGESAVCQPRQLLCGVQALCALCAHPSFPLLQLPDHTPEWRRRWRCSLPLDEWCKILIRYTIFTWACEGNRWMWRL